MAQARQNTTVRRHHVQPPVQPAAVDVRSTREQVEQLTRKLAAAQAEIRRYQTRLFACERQMVALRRENAELEAACEEARQQALQAAANAEALRQPAEVEAEELQQTAPAADAQPEEAALPVPAESAQVEPAQPEDVQPEAAAQPQAEQLPPAPVEPVQKAAPPLWSPKTKLDHLSVELMNWFDKMMGA